jgi:hypothetical protein
MATAAATNLTTSTLEPQQLKQPHRLDNQDPTLFHPDPNQTLHLQFEYNQTTNENVMTFTVADDYYQSDQAAQQVSKNTAIFGALRTFQDQCPYSLNEAIAVPVEFYSPIYQNATFTAYTCSLVKQTMYQSPDSPTGWDFSNAYETLHPEACDYMGRHKYTTEGRKMYQDRKDPTIWKTRNYIQINSSILEADSHHANSVLNCQLRVVRFTVDPESNCIRTSQLRQLENCAYDHGSCHNGHDIVVWNYPGNYTCPIQKQHEAHCYLTQRQLTCPTLHFTINDNTDNTNQCGMELGWAFSAMVQPKEPLLTLAKLHRQAIDSEFKQLYDQIVLGRKQVLRIYHVTTCSGAKLKISQQETAAPRPQATTQAKKLQ